MMVRVVGHVVEDGKYGTGWSGKPKRKCRWPVDDEEGSYSLCVGPFN